MRMLLGALVCVLATACASPAMRYTSQPLVQSELRNGDFGKVDVDEFSAASPELETLSMRGNALTPTSGTFSGDIGLALQVELDEAGLLDESADVRIDGVLLRNELHAAGIRTGSALIEVEFTVSRAGAEAYRATKHVAHEWESSFAAMKALPAAMQGYLTTMQKLLAELVADPRFQEAIK